MVGHDAVDIVTLSAVLVLPLAAAWSAGMWGELRVFDDWIERMRPRG